MTAERKVQGVRLRLGAGVLHLYQDNVNVHLESGN